MKLLRLVILTTLLFSFNNAGAATLTESPANIAQGGSVTATWSSISKATKGDWIGLYTPAGADTAFIDWLYTNTCNKAGNNSGLANGSCPFLIPNSLANGTYQLRLFSNNSYTLLATSGNFNVAPIPPARFVDNGDGTISDTQTGLMWEKKSGTVGSFVNCSTPTTCPDPHNVNNVYVWSSTGTIPDGPLFTDFLTNINRADGVSSDGQTQDRKNYSDWRIPNYAELQAIIDLTRPGCGSGTPCIDATFGPAAAGFYWSSTTFAGSPFAAFSVGFVNGFVDFGVKNFFFRARAVRGGR